ncbi:MAG: MBL fold metallo-hydrolase [candidate division Zixibacteria bacterium]|nr:MBL fold metallo-hydrolase [candidate division Zixibacteria bacterium]
MFTCRFLTVLVMISLICCVIGCSCGKRGSVPTSSQTQDFSDSPDSPDTPEYPGFSNDTLYVYCIDVGQGDATLIVSPTNKTVLIDAGDANKGYDEVFPFLDSLGITSLDYIIATHYHEDHIGGIDEVINSIGLDSIKECVYDRGWGYHGTQYDQYVTAAGSKRMEIEDSTVINLGIGITLTCVAVNGNGVLPGPFSDGEYDENDLCVALKLSNGYCDFFVAGDLSGQNTSKYKDIETSVAPEVGKVEIYQVNHHGSKYSSNEYFVSTLHPIVSILSVGDNSYGHPDTGVIARLESVASVIYQTEDPDGNVIDGDISIKFYLKDFLVNNDLYTCTYVRP